MTTQDHRKPFDINNNLKSKLMVCWCSAQHIGESHSMQPVYWMVVRLIFRLYGGKRQHINVR